MERQTLLIHYDISQPVEVSDFAKSLAAINSLYVNFARENGACQDMQNAKLCVEKVERGSIDVYMILEAATSAILPFAENANILLDFAKHINNVLSWLSGREKADYKLSKNEYKGYHEMVSVTARDYNGKMGISVFNISGDAIFNQCEFTSCEANATQNKATTEIDCLQLEDATQCKHNNVVMQISQMKTDINKSNGNKAIIEDIDKRAYAVGFASKELKSKILFSDMNPANYAFIVDVEKKSVSGKIMYMVTKLHDVVELQ